MHQFRPFGHDELLFVLQRHWQSLGLVLSPGDFTDSEANSAVARITGGNFGLVRRLLVQVARILEINRLKVVTKDVVETAREHWLSDQRKDARHLPPMLLRHDAITSHR